MLPLKLLALTEGHPVVFYDQAGCGESSRAQAANPGENTPWLLTVEYYVEELRELVAHGVYRLLRVRKLVGQYARAGVRSERHARADG